MRAHLPIILVEAVWFGLGGMLNTWLPISPGWLWAVVTIVGVVGLLVYYRSALKRLLTNRHPKAGVRPTRSAHSGGQMRTARAVDAIATPENEENSDWISESEALNLIRRSSLTQLRLPTLTMTIGEALLRRNGIINSSTDSEIRASEISRHLLKTLNEECPWVLRDGKYYRQYLEEWINEQAYRDYDATRS